MESNMLSREVMKMFLSSDIERSDDIADVALDLLSDYKTPFVFGVAKVLFNIEVVDKDKGIIHLIDNDRIYHYPDLRVGEDKFYNELIESVDIVIRVLEANKSSENNMVSTPSKSYLKENARLLKAWSDYRDFIVLVRKKCIIHNLEKLTKHSKLEVLVIGNELIKLRDYLGRGVLKELYSGDNSLIEVPLFLDGDIEAVKLLISNGLPIVTKFDIIDNINIRPSLYEALVKGRYDIATLILDTLVYREDLDSISTREKLITYVDLVLVANLNKVSFSLVNNSIEDPAKLDIGCSDEWSLFLGKLLGVHLNG